MIGGALFIVAVAVIAIWITIEVKRLKHKVFALFLIGLIILTYISGVLVFKEHSVDLTTVSGVMSAGKIYLSWLGSVFVNVKDITANAVKMDWTSTDEIEENKEFDINKLIK